MTNTLSNKKILVTKSKEQAEKAFSKLRELGAEIIYFPTIKIVSKIEDDTVKEVLLKSYHYDYLIFTSGNAVEVFHSAMEKYKLDLAYCKVAVVGSSTAEKCRGYGFYVHLMPEEFSAKGLIKKLSGMDLVGKNILIPGSSLSREDLRIGLSELGANVTFLPIYDVEQIDVNKVEDEIQRVKDDKPDIFVFTSPSSFENFISMTGVSNIETYFENSFICTIGTTTEAALRDKNLTVNIVPYIFSLEGISEAIKKYFTTTSDIA